MRTLKRYSNRRLYDAESSSTLTQTEVASMVKRGVEVRVVDAASGKDITVAVLGKIVLTEAEQWEDPSESRQLLSHIIKVGGMETMSILKNTILASIGAFNVTKAKAEKIIDDLIKKGDLDKSNRKKAIMELLAKADKSTANIRQRISSEASKAGHEVSRLAKEVKDYKLMTRSDMKKLETKLDKLTRAVSSLEKKLSQ